MRKIKSTEALGVVAPALAVITAPLWIPVVMLGVVATAFAMRYMDKGDGCPNFDFGETHSYRDGAVSEDVDGHD